MKKGPTELDKTAGLPILNTYTSSRLKKNFEPRAAPSIIVFTLAFLLISSYGVIFTDTALSIKTGNTIDTSNDHVTLSVFPSASVTESSLSKTVGTPTAQADLQIPRTLQSTDLVNSLAFYEVIFITSTTGAIDRIRMDFPAGTNIAAAGVIERVGIGGGTLLKAGSSITYDVTNPVNIPSGTL